MARVSGVCDTARPLAVNDASAKAPLARTPPAPGVSPVLDGLATPPEPPAIDYYLNRELTYLNFCWRVLHEAALSEPRPAA